MVDLDKCLEEMNLLLKGLDTSGYEDASTAPPPIHILGVPRSGTTVAIQILAATLGLGYIDNLAAMFWTAPVLGVLVAKKLLGSSHTPRSFHSYFGRTQGVLEPHEFGRFWMDALGYSDMQQKPQTHEQSIDWDMLRMKIVNMGLAFGRPYLLKSFLLTWHLARYHKAVPNSLYIRMERTPLETAASIMKLRRASETNRARWVPLKAIACSAYDSEPLPVQIASLMHFLNQALDEGLNAVPAKQVLKVSMAEVSQPNSFADRIAEWLTAAGWKPTQRVEIGALPGKDTSSPDLTPAELDELRSAIDYVNASARR